jgi:hypothetical protein
VHIADVTHFLQAGTALDDEARSRCTSVYLVDQCIPMVTKNDPSICCFVNTREQLPRILSERLCSLNSGQDSLAFSAVFELSRLGEVVNQWFGKTSNNITCFVVLFDNKKTTKLFAMRCRCLMRLRSPSSTAWPRTGTSRSTRTSLICSLPQWCEKVPYLRVRIFYFL